MLFCVFLKMAVEESWGATAREFNVACAISRESDRGIASMLAARFRRPILAEDVARWRQGHRPVPVDVWRTMLDYVGIDLRFQCRSPGLAASPVELHVIPGGLGRRKRGRRARKPSAEPVSRDDLLFLVNAALRCEAQGLPGIALMREHTLGVLYRALSDRLAVQPDEIDMVLAALHDTAAFRRRYGLGDPFAEARAKGEAIWRRLRQEIVDGQSEPPRLAPCAPAAREQTS